MANVPSLLLIVALVMVVHGVSSLTVDVQPIVRPTHNRLVGIWHIVEANGIVLTSNGGVH